LTALHVGSGKAAVPVKGAPDMMVAPFARRHYALEHAPTVVDRVHFTLVNEKGFPKEFKGLIE